MIAHCPGIGWYVASTLVQASPHLFCQGKVRLFLWCLRRPLDCFGFQVDVILQLLHGNLVGTKKKILMGHESVFYFIDGINPLLIWENS